MSAGKARSKGGENVASHQLHVYVAKKKNCRCGGKYEAWSEVRRDKQVLRYVIEVKLIISFSVLYKRVENSVAQAMLKDKVR